MTDEKVFKVDNTILERLDAFGARNPIPSQPYLPGMAPLGPFDLWLTLGCYSLLNPRKPTDPVVTTLTDILTTLDFSQTLARASYGYSWTTYSSDDYARVAQAFHRLRTVEFPVYGYWRLPGVGKGRPRRRLVESHTGILSDYGYTYGPDVLPPDQVADSKRKNVNLALTKSNEPGPVIYRRTDVEPEGIYFRMSPPVIGSLIEGEKNHIGATIFRSELFRFRRQIARNLGATKLLLRICRQTSKQWRIDLDKLVKQVGLDDENVSRNRSAVLKSLETMQSLGVITAFDHDPKTDRVSIVKAARWHFPTRPLEDDEEGLSTG